MSSDIFRDSTPSLTSQVRNARGWYVDDNGETEKKKWGYQNEQITSYDLSFKNVLDGRRIVDLIESVPKPVVIDLMSAPRTLHDLFLKIPDIDAQGLVVGLDDHKKEDWLPSVQVAYDDPKIKMHYGDITRSDTWGVIAGWIKEHGKADLVMERAMGGLHYLPQHKRMYGMLINRAWELVKPDGGMLLLETLRRDKLDQLDIDLDSWIEELRNAGLDVKYDPGDLMNKSILKETGKVMLTRSLESPSVLPSV